MKAKNMKPTVNIYKSMFTIKFSFALQLMFRLGNRGPYRKQQAGQKLGDIKAILLLHQP
jgi:hypothetical protein